MRRTTSLRKRLWRQYLDAGVSVKKWTNQHLHTTGFRVLLCLMVVVLLMMTYFVGHSNGTIPTAPFQRHHSESPNPGLCIMCSHFVDAKDSGFEECDLFDVLQNDEISKNTDLIIDGQNKECPISTDHELYPFVSHMMESKETIFEQLARFDDEDLITLHPPKWDDLTKEQQTEYSMNGMAVVEKWHLVNVQNGENMLLQWTEPMISKLVSNAKSGDFSGGTYGPKPGSWLWSLLTSGKYDEIVQGGNAMVIGSQKPWIEAVLLAAGMKHVTTAEYGTINATHPDMLWIHPTNLNKAAESVINKYDVIASYSSSEHSGLGRYGDPLDPSGDLKSMAQISCLLKPGGLLFIGVPTNIGRDALQYNAHRVYGEKRLKLMFMQFRVVDVAPLPIRVGFGKTSWWYLRNLFCAIMKCEKVTSQPWFVLQNKRGCA